MAGSIPSIATVASLIGIMAYGPNFLEKTLLGIELPDHAKKKVSPIRWAFAQRDNAIDETQYLMNHGKVEGKPKLEIVRKYYFRNPKPFEYQPHPHSPPIRRQKMYE